jgi:hypothetical protein
MERILFLCLFLKCTYNMILPLVVKLYNCIEPFSSSKQLITLFCELYQELQICKIRSQMHGGIELSNQWISFEYWIPLSDDIVRHWLSIPKAYDSSWVGYYDLKKCSLLPTFKKLGRPNRISGLALTNLNCCHPRVKWSRHVSCISIIW